MNPLGYSIFCITHYPISGQVAYQDGPNAKPVYALEGSSKSVLLLSRVWLPHEGTQLPWLVVRSNGTFCAASQFVDPVLILDNRLRDSMDLVSSANAVNTLAASVRDTGGVYFVTAFSGLLAPYWDPGAAGLLIGAFTAISPQRSYAQCHLHVDF